MKQRRKVQKINHAGSTVAKPGLQRYFAFPLKQTNEMQHEISSVKLNKVPSMITNRLDQWITLRAYMPIGVVTANVDWHIDSLSFYPGRPSCRNPYLSGRGTDHHCTEVEYVVRD